MKKIFATFLICAAALVAVSCTVESELSISRISIPSTVRHGEELVMTVEIESKNVKNIEVTFSFDGKVVGACTNPPYECRYVVDGYEPGFYKVVCLVTAGDKSPFVSQTSEALYSTFVLVTE